MDWIFDHIQFVVIAGIAMAGWLKTRMDARQERKDAESEEWLPADPYEPPAEAPQPFVPPPLPRQEIPRSFVPPQEIRRAVPPPLARGMEDMSAALLRQQEIAERLRLVKESRGGTHGGMTGTHGGSSGTHGGMGMGRRRIAAVPVVPGPATLRSRLRDPAEFRAAIVLKEILSTPVGLR